MSARGLHAAHVSFKKANAYQPKRKPLSRQECRTVAKQTGTTYAVVDGGPTGSTSTLTDHWATYDYSIKVAAAPVEVYDSTSKNSSGVQRIEDAISQNADYLHQEARKREIEERQERERRAARERRPKG